LRLTISTEFTESERNRFRNLLELANGSKYQGERENAMAAATRIAEKHGMSLDEAARWTPPETSDNKPMPRQEFYQRPRKGADFSNAAQTQQSADQEKKRWQEAMDKAKDRGLDKAEEAKKAAQEAANARRRNSKSRRNPVIHANILLKETSFSFEEIADITGLDVYQIVAMKLKSRNAA
jgi:hypothetical protein